MTAGSWDMRTFSSSARSVAVLAAVALVGVVLVACAEDEDVGTQPTPVEAPDEPEAEAVDTADELELARPVIELVDPGTEPHEALRFTPTEGDETRAELVTVTHVQLEFDGEPAPSTATPPIRIVIDSTITEVTAEGDIALTFTYGDVDVVDDGTTDEQMREQVSRGVSQLEGLSGSLTVTDRGEFIDGEIDTAAITDPTMAGFLDQTAQQMDSMTVPFPEEPVGIGAVWEVTTEATFEGIETIQVMVYELVERDGDHFVLDVELTQAAAGQQLELPGMPPGSEVELVQHEMTGAGTMTGDLTRFFPDASEVSASGVMEMRLVEDGQERHLLQRLTSEVTMNLLD